MLVEISALDIAGAVLLTIATIAELGFAFWLLIKGVDEAMLCVCAA